MMLKTLTKQKGLIDDHEEYELRNLAIVSDDDVDNKPVQYTDDKDDILANTPCDITDEIITSNLESTASIKKSIYCCSNIFIFLLFCLTVFCNGLLIYFIYKFCNDNNHEPVILLYITAIAICYLALCGMYQSFNYPQYRLSVNELRCLLDELIASYPKIKMYINGCNLFIQNDKTDSFEKIFVHSLEAKYEYHDVMDVSDDFDDIVSPAISHSNNKCWNIIEFNIYFQIRCGNEETSKHYLSSRNQFIANNVKTRQQKYISSALYVNEDGEPLNNRYLGDAPLEIGKSKQFWIVNNNLILNYFLTDTMYWIFSVLLLSQWLYVMITFALISKRKTFTICKEIYYDQKYDINRH